jgi:Arc/MetJ-type ribon-helix-helix transcriptional regulator
MAVALTFSLIARARRFRPRRRPQTNSAVTKRVRRPLLTRRSSPFTIQWDGEGMENMSKVQELRPRTDSEKITINLGYVDLGQIDLLVNEGFYSNRTDFIRTAIRNQIDRHTDAVKQSVARHRMDLGLRHYGRRELEDARASGEKLHIQVLGLAVIEADVSPELARETIGSLHVLGALQASPEVKAALRDRLS